MAAKKIKIDKALAKFGKQSQSREQKVIRCSVLIVCEGTKTEPNYFEAFELWYLYHFQNVTTGISRQQYEEKISAAVNASPLYTFKKKYTYVKKDPRNYEIMTTYGSMDSALRFAEKKHIEYEDTRYAVQNPCTTVYRLVKQLLGRDEELNKEVMDKIEK